ncbi:MAG: hypothetical protein KJ623_01680, partial [Nanoarchaeota archaeon]|nr:hypothetical protein [Nanoarchaeota archaeon]
MKLNKLIKNFRVIILIFFLIFAYITISPNFDTKGVAIKAVELNSSASLAGIENPGINIMPTQHEVIKSINGKIINNLQDYSQIIDSINESGTIRITTNKKEYAMLKTNDLGLTVSNVASSNIRKGLELAGGTRVLLQPNGTITDQERNDLIDVMHNRLNVYGLSDIKIKASNDLLGNKYILVELAGATEQEVRDLIEKQGVFEAKIGNETVFSGGKRDIKFVCRNDGACSGVRECIPSGSEEYCKFEFAITLSEAAAQRQADVTSKIALKTTDSGQQVLEKQLDLYLDEKLLDSLNIASDLKGKAVTQIAISGPGIAKTRDEAINIALANMNKLQTILITGSLPYKLNIVKIDTISPILGAAFTKNTIFIFFLSILGVSAIIFIRYRKIKISASMIIIIISEIIITLGVAAFLKQNLDLAAIAGIIAAVGTGVDDQIVIADEIS